MSAQANKISCFLATNNPGKRKEFQEFFKGTALEILDFEGTPLEIAETGKTLSENALLKAQGWWRETHTPALSDDSGLFVGAMEGELGVYSARYGGDIGALEKCQKVVKTMAGKVGDERSAEFRCHLCLYLNEKEVFYFEGVLKGKIATEVRGEGGFGYDPIFIPEGAPEGQTLAECPEWKKEHSHRRKALNMLQGFLESFQRQY